MVACYNQMDQEWWLCNSNYHKMVQIMIKIVQNASSLRIEAPEWYPNRELVTIKTKRNEDGKVNIESKDNKFNLFNKCNGNESDNNCNNEIDKWIRPRKVCVPTMQIENQN